jgi:hypothetical protein
VQDVAIQLPVWLTWGGKSSIHCAGGWVLMTIVSLLCLGVSVGYIVIAIDWRRREKQAKSHAGIKALADLRDIFSLCMVSGYVFRIILVFIPCWALYVLALCWLNVSTWRYVWRLKDLDIIYQDRALLEHIVNGYYEHLESDTDRLSAIQNDVRAYLARGRK